MDTFRALWIEQIDGVYTKSIKQRSIDSLPEGEVLIRVHYSSLNYKDALSSQGNKGVTRAYPHTPGIDAAGIVESSSSSVFEAGDEVIVTGYDLGMNTSGGLAELIRVPAHWVVPKPKNLSLRDAMVFGTAGFTAAMSVDTLLQVGLAPSQGTVLVTGASGGVGSVAVWLLANLGFEVAALTSRIEHSEWLYKLGAKDVVPADRLRAAQQKPMLKPEWAGVVDCVGGDILSNALKSTQYGGSVTCCGMVQSAELNTSVFPFILRGINLLGVDSVELPLPIKIDVWNQLADEWRFDNVDVLENELIQEIGLDETPNALETILDNHHRGRFLVNCRA